MIKQTILFIQIYILRIIFVSYNFLLSLLFRNILIFKQHILIINIFDKKKSTDI